VIHCLIRHGGADVVDRLVRDACADLRKTCFLFGEKLVYLRRAGVPADTIPFERWAELSRLLTEKPLLWEAWELIVRTMSLTPAGKVSDLVAEQGLGIEPSGWRVRIPDIVEPAQARAYSKDRDRIFRLALGDAMNTLRGKVPASEVSAELRRASEGKEQFPCRTK
jgi:Glu-tRNA(Gln) amidotransferase subunit E-like FAD-binding protein